jgi:hypothetical protein
MNDNSIKGSKEEDIESINENLDLRISPAELVRQRESSDLADNIKSDQRKTHRKSKGSHLSELAKKRISEATKGLKRSEEAKQNMSKAQKGVKKTEEQKRKISETLKGRHLSEEQKRKISLASKGKSRPRPKGLKLTEEHKKAISDGHKGKHLSEITKAKLAESHKGKPLKEDHKKNISESLVNNVSGLGYRKVRGLSIFQKLFALIKSSYYAVINIFKSKQLEVLEKDSKPLTKGQVQYYKDRIKKYKLKNEKNEKQIEILYGKMIDGLNKDYNNRHNNKFTVLQENKRKIEVELLRIRRILKSNKTTIKDKTL